MKTFFAGDGLHVAGGDLNIAPQEHDVHNHKKCRRLVGHSDGERQIMAEAIEAGGWIDTGRCAARGTAVHLVGLPLPPAFERNMGWRLDHLWLKRAHADLIRGARSSARAGVGEASTMRRWCSTLDSMQPKHPSKPAMAPAPGSEMPCSGSGAALLGLWTAVLLPVLGCLAGAGTGGDFYLLAACSGWTVVYRVDPAA